MCDMKSCFRTAKKGRKSLDGSKTADNDREALGLIPEYKQRVSPLYVGADSEILRYYQRV